MTGTTSAIGYSQPARWLHWLVAGLIILQYVLAEIADEAGEHGALLQQLAVLANHKSVGMTILALALIRLGWRFTHPAPPLPVDTPRWQTTAATSAHWLLYGLLIVLPISGWLMSSASAYSVSWFNVFVFPDLIGADPELKTTLESVHEFLAEALFIVALVHIGAALAHHFHLKDSVLRGMVNTPAIVVGLALTASGIVFLGAVTAPESTDSDNADISVEAKQAGETGLLDASGDTNDPAILSKWVIDYPASTIAFTAEQAGATFDGRFREWKAEIFFDPNDLTASHAVVEISLNSVFTDDTDRDAQLNSDSWFGDRVAVFQASRFEALEAGAFSASDATLTFGDAAYPIEFTFTLADGEDARTLEGHARLDRLALNIGTGEWRDTTWVGQYVEVNVIVIAK